MDLLPVIDMNSFVNRPKLTQLLRTGKEMEMYVSVNEEFLVKAAITEGIRNL
jgi:hypothetical protein